MSAALREKTEALGIHEANSATRKREFTHVREERDNFQKQLQTQVKRLNEIIFDKNKEVKKLKEEVEEAKSAKAEVQKLYTSEVTEFVSLLIKDRLKARKLNRARETKPTPNQLRSPHGSQTEQEAKENWILSNSSCRTPKLPLTRKKAWMGRETAWGSRKSRERRGDSEIRGTPNFLVDAWRSR
jgi:hypothetical protein